MHWGRGGRGEHPHLVGGPGRRPKLAGKSLRLSQGDPVSSPLASSFSPGSRLACSPELVLSGLDIPSVLRFFKDPGGESPHLIWKRLGTAALRSHLQAWAGALWPQTGC